MTKLILFTGGHYNSSLVIAQVLQKKGYKIRWIGEKYTNSSRKNLTPEYIEVTQSSIPFTPLITGKFYRHIGVGELIKFVIGFFESIYIIAKHRPSLIVSFGGYIAVPVVVAGYLFRVPSITHEQTVVSGWANKAIAPLVKRILVTHPQSVRNFPQKKCVVVGLPMEEEIISRAKYRPASPPLIFITCGKQGAHLINQAVFPLVKTLVSKYQIVHQLGANAPGKDIDRARRVRENLGTLSSRYSFAPYYYTKDYSKNIHRANVVISRSGAHSCYKLAFLRKRSVLIPIPWVSHNEQYENAKITSQLAPTVILEQKNLDSRSLYRAIKDVQKMKVNKTINKYKLPANATEKIVDLIEKIT